MNVSFDLSVSQFLMAIRVMLTGSKKGFVYPSVKQLLHSLFMIPFLLLERKKRSIESSTILNTINHARLSFCVLFCSFIYKKKTCINTFQIPNTHSHLQNQTNWTKLPSLDAYMSYHHRVEQSYEMDCLWINSTLFSS